MGIGLGECERSTSPRWPSYSFPVCLLGKLVHCRTPEDGLNSRLCQLAWSGELMKHAYLYIYIYIGSQMEEFCSQVLDMQTLPNLHRGECPPLVPHSSKKVRGASLYLSLCLALHAGLLLVPSKETKTSPPLRSRPGRFFSGGSSFLSLTHFLSS